MKKIFLSCIFLFCLLFQTSFGDFEIAEVMPNTSDDTHLEYFTLKNISQTSQSLSGYYIQDASNKIYAFTGLILEPQERKQFFRPETKIILNNSDETLTLFSSTGAKVDEILYSTSSKDVFLSFEDVEEVSPGESISHEVIISGEVPISEEEIIIPPILPQIPLVNISLQSPSYISQSGITDIYVCDEIHDECKVNFDLRSSFSGTFSESQYRCEIDFGLGVITGEERKCNPNTVVFSKGQSEVIFRIFSKNNGENFSEKKIKIYNLETLTSGNTGSGNTQSGSSIENIENNISIVIPEIKLGFQIPSYITKSGSGNNIYFCDPKQTECKVNFDLRNTFTGSISESDYRCEIDFGLGVITGEEQKCNPNTVIFPVGTFDVRFRVILKSDETMFQEIYISLEHTLQSSLLPSVGVAAKSDFSIKIDDIFVGIQSGLTREGDTFYCNKADCSANFIYTPLNSLERCFWDFGEGKANSKTSYTRCNPGVVHFGLGEYTLSLKVYEYNNLNNFKKIKFPVMNLFIPEVKKEISEEKEKIQEIQEGFQLLEGKIELQGKLSKEKTLTENKLLCSGVEKCYVNFLGVLSGKIEKGRNITYIWMKNSEVFSQKLNPAGEWFETGKYEILFQVYEEDKVISEQIFYIEVDDQKAEKIQENKTNSGAVEILEIQDYTGLVFGDILPNPKGNDIKEFIEIKNISENDISLSGCILSDTSRKYHLPDEILTSGSSRYFFQGETKISIGNSKETLTLFCGTSVLESIHFERKIQDDELISGKIFLGFSFSKILEIVPQNLQETYLEKSLSLSFLILKRDGLKISGTTFPNTKIELLSGEKIYFTFFSDASGKFLLKTKNIGVGTYDFDVRLSQAETNYKLGQFRTLTLSATQRNSWFQKAVRKTKVKTIALPKMIFQGNQNTISETQTPTFSLKQILLYCFLLLLVASISIGHILYISFPKRYLHLRVEQELVRFQIRQKCILLGV